MSRSEPQLDVVGVGNALVDVLVEVDPSVVADAGLMAGTMSLMALEDAERIHALIGSGIERCGGSAANTVAGLTLLGARCGFVGKVAPDRLGALFTEQFDAMGVGLGMAVAPGGGSGRCLVLITPDAQRTMCTSLGVAGDLEFDDLDADLVASAAVTYLEGYLWDPPPARRALRRAVEIAHDAGRRIALSLSDPFCVQRHRDDFAELIAADVDIVFGNADEIAMITGIDDPQAAAENLCAGRADRTVTVTLGAGGALAVTGSGEVAHQPAAAVAEVVDTTGAGDLYAAGFLRGLTQGFDLDRCVRLGVVAAGEVIGHIGARPEADLPALVATAGLDSHTVG